MLFLLTSILYLRYLQDNIYDTAFATTLTLLDCTPSVFFFKKIPMNERGRGNSTSICVIAQLPRDFSCK